MVSRNIRIENGEGLYDALVDLDDLTRLLIKASYFWTGKMYAFCVALIITSFTFFPCRVCQPMERRSQVVPCILLPELDQRLRCSDQCTRVSGAIDQALLTSFH